MQGTLHTIGQSGPRENMTFNDCQQSLPARTWGSQPASVGGPYEWVDIFQHIMARFRCSLEHLQNTSRPVRATQKKQGPQKERESRSRKDSPLPTETRKKRHSDENRGFEKREGREILNASPEVFEQDRKVMSMGRVSSPARKAFPWGAWRTPTPPDLPLW